MTVNLLVSEGDNRALWGPNFGGPWFECGWCEEKWMPGIGSDPARKLCGLCYRWPVGHRTPETDRGKVVS